MAKKTTTRKAAAGKKKASARKKPAAKASKKTATQKKSAPKPAKKSSKKSTKKPAKKPASKKSAKKAAKKPAKKPAKKSAKKTRKKTAKKTSSTKRATRSDRPAPPPASAILDKPVVPDTHGTSKARKLTKREMKTYENLLLELRDRLGDGVNFLSGDNLNRSARDSSGDLSSYSLHMADQGTDNFDRELALNVLSSEQDIIYEIDEALQRIQEGTYGLCEITGHPIERERLRAIPYARNSIRAQQELERGRPRYRAFGSTMSH